MKKNRLGFLHVDRILGRFDVELIFLVGRGQE